MKTTKRAQRIQGAAAFVLCAALASCAHDRRETGFGTAAKNPWVNVISPNDGQGEASLARPHVEELVKRYLDCYDKENGGFDRCSRLLDPSSTELAMLASTVGVPASAAMAQKTLLKNLRLIDRANGGVLEPSPGRSKTSPWETPESERTLLYQADSLRLYALAASMWGSRKYVEAARAIDSYLERDLTSPDGAFYAGVLAPGTQNSKLDARILTTENGAAIVALAMLHDITGDPAVLVRALRAADFMVENRKLPGDER
jgi:uncharacterized protein